MANKRKTVEDLMTKRVPVVFTTDTVAEVEDRLRDQASDYDTISYVYVTNKAKKLTSVLSLRELYLMDKKRDLKRVSKKNLVTAYAKARPVEVANIALKHSIKAVPVVDDAGRFLGVVPPDTIMKILSLEHTRDVLRLAGVRHKHKTAHEAVLHDGAAAHVKMRLPWLVLGLLGGVGAAMVVGFFEETLADELMLAAFIPAVVYMADAVGSQTQMLFVRTLSLRNDLVLFSYLKRELFVNSVLGLILSVMIFGAGYLAANSLEIGFVVAVSIFLTIIFSVLVAIFLPWFFYKNGKDPAIASGPLATVVRDILSLCIYLLVATIVLS